jgi:hypothetical protein
MSEKYLKLFVVLMLFSIVPVVGSMAVSKLLPDYQRLVLFIRYIIVLPMWVASIPVLVLGLKKQQKEVAQLRGLLGQSGRSVEDDIQHKKMWSRDYMWAAILVLNCFFAYLAGRTNHRTALFVSLAIFLGLISHNLWRLYIRQRGGEEKRP